MKQLKDIIIEKLKLDKDFKISEFKFKSHITNNPIEFKDNNYIIDSGDFKPMRFAILLEYANEIIKENLLENSEDIKFVKEWIKICKKAYKENYVNGFNTNSKWSEFTWLCNGEKPTFGNAKFTYDLLQYALTKDNITKPRKQKVEKMIREFWSIVETNKDKMNWY